PMTSLNPVKRISKQLIEMMKLHDRDGKRPYQKDAINLLRQMGVGNPERAVQSYPHEFSGGMRQRVMLAMGFANQPRLLIADEPTTELDVTIQAQILNLLKDVSREAGSSVIFISHDLGVIASICDKVAVMYAGQIVEQGTTQEILSTPRHPYTWALMNAAPRIDRPRVPGQKLATIKGLPPEALSPSTACSFLD